MIRILLNGCNGKMGQTVTDVVSSTNDVVIVAGIDRTSDMFGNFPVFTSINDIVDDFDVIIDFSTADALDGVLDFAEKSNKPVVLCSTGYSDEQILKIENASKSIPIFFSSNMSMGIALLTELSVRASKFLGDGFDIEIIEKHHNQKIDAPSGTACKLADEIRNANDGKFRYEYDRHSKRAKRSPDEIGIHSVRGGTIVGEHEVIFAGNDEVISLKHTAYSKKIFAVGAINAARFLINKPAGSYGMKDIL